MPGIFGIISGRSNELNIKELKAMSGSLHTEPFYHSGELSIADCGVCVGWTCHKGSFSDCMPVFNEKKDIVLIYSGENFNDPEDMDEIKKRNHVYNKSDASYLVHMYEEWGEDFLLMLNGNHHGLLVDKRVGKVILFNDRYGLHRLYYHENKGAFYFSSEAHAILQVLPELRELDTVSLAESIRYNCVLDYKSLFKGIFVLPPGSCWIFQGDETVKRKAYFKASSLEEQPLLGSEFHYERLAYVLQKVLKRYFKSKEKIGIPLNCSIDIRIILANAMYGPEKVPCYMPDALGFKKAVKVAKRLVSNTGQTLHLIGLGDEFLKRYPDFIEKTIHVAEGMVNVAGAVELYFCECAREIAPIQISSIFGEAILRKSRTIQSAKLNQELFADEFRTVLKDVAARYEELCLTDLTFILSKSIPWSGYPKMCLAQSQMVVRTPFMDNDFVGLMYRALDAVRNYDATSFRLVRNGNPLLAEGIGYRRHCVASSLLSSLFRKAPVCWRLNQEQAGHVSLFYRKLWHERALSKYVQEILLDKRSLERPYVNKRFLEHIVSSYAHGNDKYIQEVNASLTAELIHRHFLE